jgi:PTS system nitrogen regulatory IIA component
MNISDLLTPERVACNLKANSKKRALELLSNLLHNELSEISEEKIFESFIERERLGSTGLGHGVALPHARMKGQKEAIGAFIKLDHKIDYDSIDKQPVDLLFALLVPEHFTDEHLKILAQLAEMFGNTSICEGLRNSENSTQLLELLTH